MIAHSGWVQRAPVVADAEAQLRLTARCLWERAEQITAADRVANRVLDVTESEERRAPTVAVIEQHRLETTDLVDRDNLSR